MTLRKEKEKARTSSFSRSSSLEDGDAEAAICQLQEVFCYIPTQKQKHVSGKPFHFFTADKEQEENRNFETRF